MPHEPLATTTSTRRPIPGASAVDEQLLAMVTELTGQLAVARERLDTLERLIDKAGVVEQSDIEAFDPDDEASAERRSIRSRLIARVFRPLRDAADHDAAKARQEATKDSQDD